MNEDIAARVQRGVDYLTSRWAEDVDAVGEWWDQIDMATLDVTSTYSCPLAQTFGWHAAYNLADDPGDYGFDARPSDDDLDEFWEQLDDEWRRVILELRG